MRCSAGGPLAAVLLCLPLDNFRQQKSAILAWPGHRWIFSLARGQGVAMDAKAIGHLLSVESSPGLGAHQLHGSCQFLHLLQQQLKFSWVRCCAHGGSS